MIIFYGMLKIKNPSKVSATLYQERDLGGEGTRDYNNVELNDGSLRKSTEEEMTKSTITTAWSKSFRSRSGRK